MVAALFYIAAMAVVSLVFVAAEWFYNMFVW